MRITFLANSGFALDRREKIFDDVKDHEHFLKTSGEACDKTGWQVHDYCQNRTKLGL